MTKATRYLAGKYFTVEMVEGLSPAERVVAISHVAEEFIQGAEKLVLYFEGHDSGLPLNNTRIEQMIEIAGGKEETDHWRGIKVELHIDPTVRYGGRKVGGVALRAAPALQPTA